MPKHGRVSSRSQLFQKEKRKAREKRKRLRIKLAGKLRQNFWLGKYIIALFNASPARTSAY
jgi:hypothetical protein